MVGRCRAHFTWTAGDKKDKAPSRCQRGDPRVQTACQPGGRFKADSPTFTGTVTVPDPAADSDAASKSYVDADSAKIKRGSATFAAEASKAVVFGAAFADTNYRITLSPDAEVATWYADKAVGGFTIHTSANHTGDVDWVAAHD